MESNEIIDEDEEVIIKGSSLYEHLQKLGYSDFESIIIEKTVPVNEEKNSKITEFMSNIKNVFKKLCILYLEIIQDDSVSNNQIETVLNAKILLNDHGYAIHNFLDKYNCKPWRSAALKFILFGTLLSSSLYMYYNNRYNSSTSLFVFTAMCCASYIQYLRLNAQKNLKSVVSLQNDLFDLCKKGMKILKYGYKIKLSKGKSSQQYSDLIAGRLKYLQPLLEDLVKFLEHTSCIYYHASLILLTLLPVNVCNEADLLTRFRKESFQIQGEINYQKLKILYHIYILTQSEMLHLLAIAYDNYTWRKSYKKIPESKLAHIVHFLRKHLTIYKEKLLKNIEAYYSFKLQPISYKYRGLDSSRWQDLYMHLDLASNKLQLAYGHVLSVLQDIDNDVIEDTTSGDSVENTMQKLNAAQKSIETAKDFVEFSSLFLVKSQINSSTSNCLEVNVPTSEITSDIRIVTDTEPEIMDEVFEEYIKEEYLKPLNEEADEITLYNYKRDKTLFKNFMTELKDALVDKKKNMSERESKALQRMQKIITKQNNSDNQEPRIPTPPPMPSFNIFSIVDNTNDNKSFNDVKRKYKLPEKASITELSNKMEDFMRKSKDDTSIEERSPISALPLPRNIELPSFVPPSFLREETFIGSGENSEEEQEGEGKTETKTEEFM